MQTPWGEGIALGRPTGRAGKNRRAFQLSAASSHLTTFLFLVPDPCVGICACKIVLYPELIYFLFQWEHLAHGFLSQCCTSEASAASFQISIFIFPDSLQLFSGFAKHVI